MLLSITWLKTAGVYIINDLTRKMPIETYILLKDRMKKLALRGALVIFLTEDHVAMVDRIYNNCGCWDSTRDWTASVTRCSELM